MDCDQCNEHSQVEHLIEWRKAVDVKLTQLCERQKEADRLQRSNVSLVQYRWVTGMLIMILIAAGGSISAGLVGTRSAILSVGSKVEILSVEVRKENERQKARLNKEELRTLEFEERLREIDRELYENHKEDKE